MSWLTDRLATSRWTRPYPLTPLAHALGLDPHDTQALANAVGIHRSWIKRVRRLGLTEQQADHWATRAGLHPLDIWPRWAANLPPTGLANANRITCPNGHPYDHTRRGRRECTACERVATRRRVAAHRARNRRSPKSVTPFGPMTPTDWDHYDTAAEQEPA